MHRTTTGWREHPISIESGTANQAVVMPVNGYNEIVYEDSPIWEACGAAAPMPHRGTRAASETGAAGCKEYGSKARQTGRTNFDL